MSIATVSLLAVQLARLPGDCCVCSAITGALGDRKEGSGLGLAVSMLTSVDTIHRCLRQKVKCEMLELVFPGDE